MTPPEAHERAERTRASKGLHSFHSLRGASSLSETLVDLARQFDDPMKSPPASPAVMVVPRAHKKMFLRKNGSSWSQYDHPIYLSRLLQKPLSFGVFIHDAVKSANS